MASAKELRENGNDCRLGKIAGLTITANISMSLAIHNFGWVGMEVRPAR